MPTSTTTPAPSHTEMVLTASCTTAVPGKYGNVPINACNSYYNYDPAFVPAIAVCVIFGILTAIHLTQAIYHRKRYAWVIVMGSGWETTAFALLAVGAHHQQQSAYATAHLLLFLLAPLWINAFAYMTLARMVYYFLPAQAVWRIRGTSLAKYFVWLDIVSFIVQAAGGIMTSPGSDPSVLKAGMDTYMVGVGVQEGFILAFIALMVGFQRQAGALERTQGAPLRERGWRGLLYALYGALVAISVRIIYRIAEYARGVQPSNPVPYHEFYSYALDAFPMMVAILLLAVFHPGRTLRGPESEFPRLSRKEKKAAKREAKEAKRLAKTEKREARTAVSDEYEGVPLASREMV